jgi:hypothetical protein
LLGVEGRLFQGVAMGQGRQETGLGTLIDCLWVDIGGMPVCDFFSCR